MPLFCVQGGCFGLWISCVLPAGTLGFTISLKNLHRHPFSLACPAKNHVWRPLQRRPRHQMQWTAQYQLVPIQNQSLAVFLVSPQNQHLCPLPKKVAHPVLNHSSLKQRKRPVSTLDARTGYFCQNLVFPRLIFALRKDALLCVACLKINKQKNGQSKN